MQGMLRVLPGSSINAIVLEELIELVVPWSIEGAADGPRVLESLSSLSDFTAWGGISSASESSSSPWLPSGSPSFSELARISMSFSQEASELLQVFT
jgi:hypothetical protein